MSKIWVAAVLILCLSRTAWTQSASEGFVMESEGMQHLVSHAEPTYPPIAKTIRLQGSVLLHVSVDATGAVTKVDAVGGPAMLRQAAVDAVTKWTYRPFEVDGKPAAVKLVVSVPFSLGIPAVEEKSDEAIGTAYFPKADEWRAADSTGRWNDAVKACGDLVAIAGRFPNQTSRSNEIRLAHQDYGEALSFSGQQAAALEQFHLATELANSYLKPSDVEYGTAYYWQAFGEHSSHMPAEAERDYSVAESSYRKAIINLPDMSKIYSRYLAHTLAFHSVLMEQTGQLERMKAMREEALSLDPHALDGMKGSN
jgi:TonB family protein